MNDSPVTPDEYRRRLAAVCLSGGGPGLPRKPRDRHILFRAVAAALDAARLHTEREIDEALQAWLEGPGELLELDRVSLRREMVDAGYLERDPAGREYRVVRTGSGVVTFEPGVEGVDPAAALEEARADAERRRLAATGRPGRAR